MDDGKTLQPFGMAPSDDGSSSHDASDVPASTSSRRAPPSVKVIISRPDGSTRELIASGFFREEYLCAMLDEELCNLSSDLQLIVHLIEPDKKIVRSLRERWRGGLSDNRRVRIREILGPNDDPDELSVQLAHIETRLKKGDKIHLAIRSPRIARFASGKLRRILLKSQHGELSSLRVSVYGTEEIQRAIMEHMEGMVRAQDYELLEEAGVTYQFAGRLPKRPKHRRRKSRRRHRDLSSHQEVKNWIRKVERNRETED